MEIAQIKSVSSNERSEDGGWARFIMETDREWSGSIAHGHAVCLSVGRWTDQFSISTIERQSQPVLVQVGLLLVGLS